MAKARQPPKGRPRQLSIFISEQGWRLLAALQQHYATRAGLLSPVTQPEAIEIMLRETTTREGLKLKGGTK